MIKEFKIKNEELIADLLDISYEFPKYTTQIINLANQNAQGTRPKMVGQMSELIQEFPGNQHHEWIEWYQKQYPEAIDKATNKIYDMILNLKEAVEKIDRKMVKNWVKDVIFNKTFIGLRFQESILKRLAAANNLSYKLADSKEESQGIDGYIGQIAVSIKPDTYKTKSMLHEDFKCEVIYYKKIKTGIAVEVNFELS